MDPDTFHARMLRLDRLLLGGQLTEVLVAACALRTEVQTEPSVPAAQLAWPLYTELRALHALGRWGEAVALVEAHGPMLAFLGSMNHAHAASLAMECATRAGRTDRLAAWARICLQQRLADGDWDAARLAVGTALALAGEAEAAGHTGLHAQVLDVLRQTARRRGRPEPAGPRAPQPPES